MIDTKNIKTISDARKIFSEGNYLRCPTKRAMIKMEEMLSAIDSVQSNSERALWQSISHCLYRETDPYVLAEKKEISDFTASLLDVLPTNEAVVLFLIYWKNFTLEKCARRFGVTRQGIRYIQMRALRRLRNAKYWKGTGYIDYVEDLL